MLEKSVYQMCTLVQSVDIIALHSYFFSIFIKMYTKYCDLQRKLLMTNQIDSAEYILQKITIQLRILKHYLFRALFGLLRASLRQELKGSKYELS